MLSRIRWSSRIWRLACRTTSGLQGYVARVALAQDLLGSLTRLRPASLKSLSASKSTNSSKLHMLPNHACAVSEDWIQRFLSRVVPARLWIAVVAQGLHQVARVLWTWHDVRLPPGGYCQGKSVTTAWYHNALTLSIALSFQNGRQAELPGVTGNSARTTKLTYNLQQHQVLAVRPIGRTI